jgi:hypothetical protein
MHIGLGEPSLANDTRPWYEFEILGILRQKWAADLNRSSVAGNTFHAAPQLAEF